LINFFQRFDQTCDGRILTTSWNCTAGAPHTKQATMQCNYNAHPKCANHLHTVVVVAFAAGYKFLFVVNVNACTDVLAITLAVVVAVVIVVVAVLMLLPNCHWCCFNKYAAFQKYIVVKYSYSSLGQIIV